MRLTVPVHLGASGSPVVTLSPSLLVMLSTAKDLVPGTRCFAEFILSYAKGSA